MLKLLSEHPIGFVLSVVLMIVLCWVAMSIGFAVMTYALKALTWTVVKLDDIARLR